MVGPAIGVLLAANAFVPLLGPGDAVPPIPLIDQTARPFSFDDLRGRATIVSFIYTRCPDPRMCPLVSAKFARLQQLIGRGPVHLVEVTLDPRFDSPAVLRRYGAAYGADPRTWTLATGAPGSIDDLAERFGISVDRVRPGTIAHTEAVAVLDPTGAIVQIVPGNAWTPEDALALARPAGDAAPLARLRVWLTSAVARCGGGVASLNALEIGGLFAIVASAIGAGFARAFPLKP